MSYKGTGVFGWGIMGTGRIAKQFAECLEMTAEGKIVAVGSRKLETAQEFCDRFGGKAYGSYQEMVNDPDVDIVYVATPHQVHEEDVVMAAKAGKAILCEKPFAINVGQTERMIAAAKEHGVFLMEGLWSRFFPAWQYARDLIASGELGEIEAIHSTTCWGKKDLPDSNRLLNPELSGGSLLDAGVYSLAAVGFIMGDRKIENMTSAMRLGHTGVDETTSISLTYEGNVIAAITSAIFGWSFATEVICEKATVYIPRHRNPDTVIVRKRIQGIMDVVGEEEVHKFPFEGEGFQYEIAAVHDCLRQGLLECPVAPLSETLQLSSICTEIRKKAGFVYPFE